MKIEFDKRLELIYGILYCVDRDMNKKLNPGLFVEELPTYCNEFYDLYKKNISEELIQYIKDYGINGNWNQPAVIALSLDEDYNIIENYALIDMVLKVNKKFDKQKTERLLKEFVLKSNYELFFDNHSKLYEKIINSFKQSISKYKTFNEKTILDFYGYKIGNMSIKLYNFTTGSQGLMIGDNQYYVQRVANIGKDENNFEFKPKLHILIHEFSHPYIGPLVEKYLSNLDFSNFYKECIKNGFPKCYHDNLHIEKSYQLFNEYLVRTVEIYLGSMYLSKQDIENEIKRQKESGFIDIEELIKVFDKKENYNNFEEFFKNEIVNYCTTLSNENLYRLREK